EREAVRAGREVAGEIGVVPDALRAALRVRADVAVIQEGHVIDGEVRAGVRAVGVAGPAHRFGVFAPGDAGGVELIAEVRPRQRTAAVRGVRAEGVAVRAGARGPRRRALALDALGAPRRELDVRRQAREVGHGEVRAVRVLAHQLIQVRRRLLSLN